MGMSVESGVTCGAKLLRSSLIIAVFSWAHALAYAQPDGSWQTYGTENGEWRSYGGDIASTKYSPLAQINAENFDELEVAWRWKLVDGFLSKTMPDGSEWWAPLDAIVGALVEETPNLYRIGHAPNLAGFQATPLMVGGVLYFNTRSRRVSRSMPRRARPVGCSTRRATRKERRR